MGVVMFAVSFMHGPQRVVAVIVLQISPEADLLLLFLLGLLGLRFSVMSLVQMDLVTHVFQVNGVSQILIGYSEPSRLIRHQLFPLRRCTLLCIFLG
jgi:hypothetical protein